MRPTRPIDQVDRDILNLLRLDARRTIKDIAEQVGLSAAPVKRRIERLERDGVIAGYTVRIDEGQLGGTVEAFTELRYAGDLDQEEILTMLSSIAEVESVYAMTGTADALVHFRVDQVGDLRRVIAKLRRQGNPLNTRTLIVLESRSGGRQRPEK
ncbi:MAG TPA: Lrp/AsnC family transcriptional regulator [Acidimicrobiales bacterium]|jgi:DNA-binding Lrp family transcriptional regulator|nr:Lrp/AsnC family transcriptional regulator [Acidimicrobiales bacterium]